MNEILQYLKKHGEKLDMEIALATGISLANVRLHLSELATKGEIMTCHLIRHEKGKTVEGISCRIAGYIPPAAPGRKSKAQLMGADKSWVVFNQNTLNSAIRFDPLFKVTTREINPGVYLKEEAKSPYGLV